MVLLALISGLINLSSQVVFQKVVSMIVGDLYTTFIAVTLTFIFGSALGSYLGHRFRSYLPWIELLTGLFSLAIFALLKGPLYSQDVPLILVIAALFLPALALGTHIPLYSYYLRRMRFGLVYFVYHFGAIFSLLFFEWHFVNAGSLSLAVLVVALTQIILGVALLALNRRGVLAEDPSPQRTDSLFHFVMKWPLSILTVFVASTISFYIVFWALKTQNMLTNSFRLHATSISASVFFWMALAGVLSALVARIPSRLLFLGMAASLTLISGTFSSLAPVYTKLFSGDLLNYFVFSFGLSCFLTSPAFFSSLIFVRETNVLKSKMDVDVASGALNFFSSFGNIAGFAAAATMASSLWEPPYFQLAVAAVVFFSAALCVTEKKYRVALPLATAIALCAFSFSQVPMKDSLFINRMIKQVAEKERPNNVRIISSPLATVALYDHEVWDASKNRFFAFQRKYVVEGLLSHDLWQGDEYIAGVSAAKYFSEPLRRSLVIGVGTGQSSWAVASISEQTDLVEISPAVLDNLNIFKEFNNDLLRRENVSFFLKDGFGFVRDCKPGTYDLIFNTSTQPSSYNASKLYSDDFVSLAKRCLSEAGVLQTYFDIESVRNLEQLQDYLAPLLKHFKYVDIMTDPYPFVFSSNVRHSIHTLSASDFIKKSDYDFFVKRYSDPTAFKCKPFFQGVTFPQSPQLSTLDQSFIERNAIQNSIYYRYNSNPQYVLVNEFYKPATKSDCL